MKIYLASSWKNKHMVMEISRMLKIAGHKVDAFCDPSDGRTSFNWTELTDIMEREGMNLATLDAKDMSTHWRVKEAFDEDKRFIKWADALILMLPSGKSSHLEAGYAAGIGKKVYILGGFEPGEFDVMYNFATALFRYEELPYLLDVLKEGA